MNKSILLRAGIGSIFVAIGIALMISASNDLRHEISPEQTAQEVAEASAEMTISDDVISDDIDVVSLSDD